MSTEETEKTQSSQTGLIVFLLIVILGVLLFILYMIYQYRQKTVRERLSLAFGVKKKSKFQSLGQSFLKSIRADGHQVASSLRKSFRNGKHSKRSISSRKQKKD